jgi:recombination protein RecA
MALPAAVLERLQTVLTTAGVHLPSAHEPKVEGLSLGVEALDAVLPDHGLLRGGVVELSVSEPGALATSIALRACRAVQQEAKARGASTPYCAFVDPSATLYAPGIAELGVDLERLVVVRPPLEALSRVALKLTESPAFSLVVIDTLGTPGALQGLALGSWARAVRRLSMAVEGSERTVLLLTDAAERRPLPLPVAQRLEISRPKPNQLLVRVAKDRRGRIGPAKPVIWARSPAWPQALEAERGRRTA